MIRSVTWRCHRDNVPGMCQSPAASEGPKRFRCEFKRRWIEPGGPTVRKVSAYTPNPSTRGAKFAGGDKDFTIWEMCKAAIMIHVQMGENDLFHITRSNAQRTQLGTDFFFPIDSKNDFPSGKGMVRRPCFEQMRSLASVDYDDTFLVLDRPSVRRQPLGPVPVGENGKPSCQPVPVSLDLRTFYFNEAGLDCVNTHGSISLVCGLGIKPERRELSSADAICCLQNDDPGV